MCCASIWQEVPNKRALKKQATLAGELLAIKKSQFQFAFVVSHIESMRDTVDSLLEISKTNGFSKVDFT